jgi:hypothetical protein
MTTPSPQGLPVPPLLAAEVTRDDESKVTAGPTVGASDVDADAAASGANATLRDVTRDSDGVPVGLDDVEEDKRASGA